MKKMMVTMVFAMIALMMVGTAAAQLSVQLKRTNPGIATEKNAELIFDIVNTDISHQIEGFLWCKSPDDAVISSTYGVGSGSGAQYISPKFNMDEGPSQEAMTITVDSDSVGDKRTGCYVKYIPFEVTEVTSVVTETVTEIDSVTGEEITKEVTKEIVDEVRSYLKLNGDYVDDARDQDYREIRLDKTVPFVAAGQSAPSCPEGQTSCTTSQVLDLGDAGQLPIAWIIIGVLVIVLLVVYLLGKSSRQ